MGIPTLIYCADGNPGFASIAINSGWKYGAKLPSTTYQPVYFADQDWKKPELDKYLAAIKLHRPRVATVIDWERYSQLGEVLRWGRLVAPFVSQVVVIPKVPGFADRIPRTIGGKPVILGYSVPTSFGGTTCELWEFEGWPVHLLGGSPHRQFELSQFMNVVSLDGNMTAQQSRKGRFWSPIKGPKGHWVQLREAGDHRRTGVPSECFARSLTNVREAWLNREVASER